jgi:CheY-like chemotaxis protein
MGGSPIVLIVEDEWLLRDCIAAHLRAAQWRTLEARSGEAAVSVLEAGKHVDVVFTDIQLGGAINGWEVGARFRRVLPQIPIIYTSGDAHPSALAVAESFFFAKPYEPNDVVRACRTSIGEAQ